LPFATNKTISNKRTELSSTRIITLTDFPVYNVRILEIYYHLFKDMKGDILPSCALIHKDLILPYFGDDVKSRFESFYQENSGADYFLLNGSHRSSAQDLNGLDLRVVIFENSDDINRFKNRNYSSSLFFEFLDNLESRGLVDSSYIDEARELVQRKELFDDKHDESIEDVILDIVDHFTRNPYFETVCQKTRRMIERKVIPAYLGEGLWLKRKWKQQYWVKKF